MDNTTDADEPMMDVSSGTLKGVSLSPRSSSEEDFTGFFEEASRMSDIVMWTGDWYELGKDNGIPRVITGLSSTYDYTPLIAATIHSAGELIRPLVEDSLQNYRNYAIDFVREYAPAYLGLGIEINSLYLKYPDEFEKYVEFYNRLYEVIKGISPETRIFTIFQLEKMKGLSLWELEENKEHWELITSFKTDIAAFTTYPGLYYRDPSNIPRDHYLEILEHTDKPIAFTEIGWHSANSPQGWESSEMEQSAFVETFYKLTCDLDTEISVWSFLYDPEAIEPFNSMGLRRDDGTARPSFVAWRDT